MPGLKVGLGGGVRSFARAASPPPTVSAAAFGSGAATTAGNPKPLSLLSPKHATGIHLWVGVLSVGALIFLYVSAPA
jgi:hypothetical protein